jgi:ADP-ribose pyrophosphatase YjhB (NUDIX family)
MVDGAEYPVLFGTTQATWGPIDLRFQLLTGEVDPDRVAACTWSRSSVPPAGGRLEPGERVRAALERELAEEAGARLLNYTPFAVLRCHSRAAGPYRPHEPHPDYDHLYAYGEVEVVGPPQLSKRTERTVAVKVMTLDQVVAFLASKGRAWEADLYRLAATRRAADPKAG